MGSDRSVRYRAFSAAPDILDDFTTRQGDHPTKLLALRWLTSDPLLGETFSLLDIGCGPGVFARMIRDAGLSDRIRYTGLDQSGSALDYCRSKYPFRFLQRDLQTEGLPAEKFDVITIHEVV